MAGAYFVIGFFPHLFSIFLFVLLLSASEVLVFPTIDNMVSDMASQDMLSTYYGFVDIGWAIGATLGNLLGGTFFGFVQANHIYEFAWLSYGCLCLAALPLIVILRRPNPSVHVTRI